MSGVDNVVINNLERASSTDIDNLQSIAGRFVAETLANWLLNRQGTASTSMPTETRRSVVLGGLEATPLSANVSISPGILVQDSATLAPTPGALDSDYRWGRLDAVATVTMPSPVSNTWYLVEGQVDQTTTLTALVDIYNPATETFVPTSLPKRKENSVVFQVTTGTSTDAPTPTGGNWVPLAVVFRPAGGGAVTADHIYDVRPTIEHNEGGVQRTGRLHRSITTYNFDTTGADGCYAASVNFEGWINGKRGWIKTGSLLGPSLLTAAGTFGSIVDPSNSTVASTQGVNNYLYLAPWYGLMPRGQRIMSRTKPSTDSLQRFDSRGILVISTVAPATQGDMTNGAAVTLPHPWSNYAVPAGEAICLGAFKKRSAAGYYQQNTTMETSIVGGVNQFYTFAASGSGFPEGAEINFTGGSPAGIGAPPLTAQRALIHVSTSSGISQFNIYLAAQSDAGIAGDIVANLVGSGSGFGLCEMPIVERTTFDLNMSSSSAGSVFFALVGWID
jgi:hypothetical protein